MIDQNWLVTEDGSCVTLIPKSRSSFGDRPYRLYRFLTDLEDVLATIPEIEEQLQTICSLVRQLLRSAEWLPLVALPPDPVQGWSVLMLYDEPDFPLTVQLVAWSPGIISPIHNHAAWGIVALLSGMEKNRFWRRSPTVDFPDQIEAMGDRTLLPGEMISFLPDAIHSVEAIGPEPTISFNVYGKTDYTKRFEFDPNNHTATLF
jgi:predicted metal-dependent enzyme (double-stranded beta helix superfamily)